MANPKKEPADEASAAPAPALDRATTAAVAQPASPFDDPGPLAQPQAKPALVQLDKPAPEKAAPAAPTTTTVDNSKRPYKVWAHGTLHRNGTIHRPGDVLTMTPTEAAKIPCLEPVD